MNHQPPVSVIVPAVAATESLAGTITAALSQDYAGDVEVVVAAPAAEMAAVSRLVDDPRLRVVENPDGRTPTGLNAAFAAAGGDVIVRCDAHALLPAGYIATAVRILDETGAWNVGGIQRPVAAGRFARAVAAAQSTPLGVGDARYRLGGDPGPVDTVYLGVYPRTVLERLGGYTPDLDRNQDYELNIRIREAGGVVWFDPRLVVDYSPRTTIAALARQYYDYGRWKRRVIHRHPGTVRWRQLAAPVLVLALIGSVVAAAAGAVVPAVAVPLAYVAGLIVTGFVEALVRRDPAVLLSPVAIATMHLAWGIGFLLPQPASSR